MDNAAPSITATMVAEKDRTKFLPNKLGGMCTTFEMGCFDVLNQQTKEYRGDYWDFFQLSNGGFYIAPSSYDEGFNFSVPGNQFAGHMTKDAAGIVASLVSLNALLWQFPTQHLNDLFFQLREFAIEHAEHPAILGAID